MTNKILTIGKKISLIFWGIMVCFQASAQDIPSELAPYFYTYKELTYSMNAGSNSMRRTRNLFKVENDDNLLCLMEITSDIWRGERINMNEIAYVLSIDKERQAIISTFQAKKNAITNIREASDNITLFILPKDSNPIKWKENHDGEIYDCSAKFVYISFWSEGKKLYRKAVKIEKATPVESGTLKEWSYWVKDYSNIASFGYWGTPDKTKCSERSNLIDNNLIEEVSKEEYDRNRATN